MSDIVVRLTLNVPCFDSKTDRPRSKPCGYDGGLCPECRKKQDAADTIEALRGENARLKEALLDIKHFGTGFAKDRAIKALAGETT